MISEHAPHIFQKEKKNHRELFSSNLTAREIAAKQTTAFVYL